MAKTIICAALNGPSLTRGQCPTVPFTPAELAAEAELSWQAGAACVHVYAREDGGSPSYRAERYREVVAAIRDRCPVLVSMSTGLFGVGLEERMAPVEARPDLVLLPAGTITWARYNARQRVFDYDHVFANRFTDMVALATRARELGVVPIAACYDLGHVASVRSLQDMGALPSPVAHAFVLGLTGGLAATPHQLCRLVADRDGGPWQLALGSGQSWRMLGAALALGGHLRVGLQDDQTLPSGELADGNAALVEAAATICRSMGAEPATVDDARRIHGLTI